MDDTACNHSLTATISGECEYPEENYDCSGNCNVEIDCFGTCGGILVDDVCGLCGGIMTDPEECPECPEGEILDCHGLCVINGSEVLDDECGVCDGDNSSCTGCMDDTACNHSLTATISGECEYPEENYDCSGNCNVEVDCFGTCGSSLVDDVCGVCGGDNSSCTGCMDDTACNYSLTAIISGECEYAVENYDCSGNCNIEVDCAGTCGGSLVDDVCGVCDGDGTSCLSIDNHIHDSFSINNIYPNPFNPVVNIEYSLATSDLVNISIYDLNGQLVDQLFTGNQVVGNHNISWHASEMSSGIYIIMIQSGDVILSDQLILLK
jgi:hypothetical protein